MIWFRRRPQPEEPPSSGKPQGLTASQQRALNSTLVHLEQRLLSLEELLRADAQGMLLRRTGHLSQATRQRILHLFGQLKQEIALLSAEQALPGTEEDVRATLVGTASILWADLEDIRPHALARYGAVDPALEAAIGPSIERLIQGVLSIETIVRDEERES